MDNLEKCQGLTFAKWEEAIAANVMVLQKTMTAYGIDRAALHFVAVLFVWMHPVLRPLRVLPLDKLVDALEKRQCEYTNKEKKIHLNITAGDFESLPPLMSGALIDFLQKHRAESQNTRLLDHACFVLGEAELGLGLRKKYLEFWEQYAGIGRCASWVPNAGQYMQWGYINTTLNQFWGRCFTARNNIALAFPAGSEMAKRTAILDLFLAQPHRRGYFENITIAEAAAVVEEARRRNFSPLNILGHISDFIADITALKPEDFPPDKLITDFA